MRVYFIGKTYKSVSAFKNVSSIELQRSSLTAKHNMAISSK